MAIKYANNFGKTIPFSFNSPCMMLAQNTQLAYTVPGNSSQVFKAIFSFNANSNVFVAYNSTAAVPPSGTAVSTGRMEFKPDERYVNGGDVLNFITPDTNAYCGVALSILP